MADSSLLQNLLNGERAWGGLQDSRGHGIVRRRLVVYPPGITRDERKALRLQRAYSVWGLGLWLLVEVSLMTVIPPWGAVGVATATCMAIGAVIHLHARHVRGRTRTLSAVGVVGVENADVAAQRDEIDHLTTTLLRADEQLAAGEITPAEHEAQVWRVYNRLPA